MRITTLLALVALGLPPTLAAQVPVAFGDRIKLVASHERLPTVRVHCVRRTTCTVTRRAVVGTLVWSGADSVVLEEERHGTLVAVPTRSIDALYVSRGQGGNVGLSALRGGLILGALGLMASVASIATCGQDPAPPPSCGSPPRSIAAVTGVAAGLGALAGVILGGSTRERWTPARLGEAPIAITAAPRGLVAVGTRITF